MLGRRIADPDGREGAPGEAAGLGLLDVETVIGGDKRLGEPRGTDVRAAMPVRGYEMHLGSTDGPGLARPMLALDGRARRRGQRRWTGRRLLSARALRQRRVPPRLSRPARRGERAGSLRGEIDTVLDALADHLEASLDLAALLAASRPPRLIRAA